MSKKTADLLCLACVLLPVLLAAWWWPALPDPMPSHWNASGEVDGYLPKFWGVAILPLAAAASWGIMKLIPVISPQGFRTDSFLGTVRVFQFALVAFLSLIGVLVLLEARGAGVPMNRVVIAAVGVLFIVIGNFLGKVRKNFFIGIRTPWTLASDEVWARTHRLAGWLFVGGGLVMLAGGLADLPVSLVIGVVLVAALYPVLHSFLLYRRLEGFAPERDGDPGDSR